MLKNRRCPGPRFLRTHLGKGTLAAKAAVRKVVKHLEEDRPLYPGHNAMMGTIKKRDILHAVESAIGELKTY